MSLRPRYSLLTLLVLTALVAGGVKLWYGPHHVVEWIGPAVEREFTYTRNWKWEAIIDGPEIQRTYGTDGKIFQSDLYFHRKGERLRFRYIFRRSAAEQMKSQNYPLQLLNHPLQEQELQLFNDCIERERQKYHEQGFDVNLFEGYFDTTF